MDSRHSTSEATSTPTAKETIVRDGRSERGARNREAILDAVFRLIEHEERMPTAERAADAAGVGIRTVFRHFNDMEGLYAEVWQRVHAELRDVIEVPLAEGSVEERSRIVFERRCELFERMAPFRRAAALQKDLSTFLRTQREQNNGILRLRLFAIFPELEGAPPALVEALDLMSSFEAWNRLKVDQGLSNFEARVSLETAFLSLMREAIQ